MKRNTKSTDKPAILLEDSDMVTKLLFLAEEHEELTGERFDFHKNFSLFRNTLPYEDEDEPPYADEDEEPLPVFLENTIKQLYTDLVNERSRSARLEARVAYYKTLLKAEQRVNKRNDEDIKVLLVQP